MADHDSRDSDQGAAGPRDEDAEYTVSKSDGAPTPVIVAIGASAGGLEPIETFFQTMPVGTGLAFVVVQHLSPDFRSMMPELLARRSSLEIKRVSDGMEIEPNTIYLNPPRASMSWR